MVTFETTVSGIPCWCLVTHYAPANPMQVTDSGFGDAIAPEPEEFEFQIFDRGGYRAPWLERKLKPADRERLLARYKETRNE